MQVLSDGGDWADELLAQVIIMLYPFDFMYWFPTLHESFDFVDFVRPLCFNVLVSKLPLMELYLVLIVHLIYLLDV